MASSNYATEQYTSEHFVESAGSVMFAGQRVCIIFYKNTGEWLLPKGRRNVGESRQAAAVREAQEETGYTCSIMATTMKTRCPPAVEEDTSSPDKAREYEGVREPFMVTLRHVDESNVKVIWWYLTVIDHTLERGKGEEQLEAELFGFEEARNKLTFANDREVLDRAVAIYAANAGL